MDDVIELAPQVRRSAAQGAAERVARESYGKLVAYLAARSRDVAGAQDALADAFAAALSAWPKTGVPGNPAGWLFKAAQRRLIDAARRGKVAAAGAQGLALLQEGAATFDDEREAIPDRRLALMFACAHPAIDPAIRAPLMMQSVLGLDAAAIASAYLVAPSAMGQRLSRTKAKIRVAGVPFRIPSRDEWPARLEAVLEAIYGAFSFGWGEAFAEDPRGRDLSDEAIWLARVVVSLAPDDPEALGALSLMLHVQARRAARRDGSGRYVPLLEQCVGLWDVRLIGEAEELLRAAGRFERPGRFQIEAAIQSAHAMRRFGVAVDWRSIAWLYQKLLFLTHSPVVAVNCAVALANVGDVAAGLAVLAEVEEEGGLAEFQSYWAAKAELSARAGDIVASRAAYERAIGLERDPAVRAFLQARRASLAH